MIEALLLAAEVAGAVLGIIGFVCFIVRPVRERVFGLQDIKEGIQCQLRSDMLGTYYKHQRDCEIHQYEYENFMACYKAYKALRGNSFIDKIREEVQDWTVIP